MIDIASWTSCLCEELSNASSEGDYDVAYTGVHAVDERTRWADEYLTKVSRSKKTVRFDFHESSLYLNSDAIPIRTMDNTEFELGSKVLVDATTLAFPELLYLFNIFNHRGVEFDVLYVQPQGYDNNTLHSGEIEPIRLSLDGLGPQILPPYIQSSQRSLMLVFIGFEGHRLGSISNSDVFGIPEYSCLLGVPGFRAGWENKAVYNNMPYLTELNVSDIRISGANDPVYTYSEIKKKYQVAKAQRKNLFLAPFGTKPAGIAAAAFAVNNPSNLGIVYDFIQSKPGRSSGTDMAHVWRFVHSHV